MEGINETKECLIALNAVSIKIISLLKKHAGVAEVVASVIGDEELKSALELAYQGVSKVPAELKDIDLSEGIELALIQAKNVPALIDALKA